MNPNWEFTPQSFMTDRFGLDMFIYSVYLAYLVHANPGNILKMLQCHLSNSNVFPSSSSYWYQSWSWYWCLSCLGIVSGIGLWIGIGVV